LQKRVCGQLDLFVSKLRSPILARDESRPMDTAEVPVDKGVAALGLVGRSLGQAEVPVRVLAPGVFFQELVLVLRARLGFAPIAFEDVLARVDETPRVSDCTLVDRICGDDSSDHVEQVVEHHVNDDHEDDDSDDVSGVQGFLLDITVLTKSVPCSSQPTCV
jgi:hypothetical protein